MPEMLGWEVARRARELRSDLPVILVTGWGDQLDLAQVPAQHVRAMVRKPFRSQEILRIVAECLPAPGGPGAERPTGC
jgi:CheY-like chemotaxis protein